MLSWRFICALYFVVIALLLSDVSAQIRNARNVDSISDHKSFKKLLRVRTNVLVLFVDGMRNEDASVKSVLNTFSDAADKCTGIGTFAMVDCSAVKESKKLCKKLKIEPNPYTLRHYHNGEYRKEYDRQLTSKSITRFMNDPTGDIPWDEDPSSANVVHIENRKAFTKLLAMKRPTLVMFYAPWCGHCKRLKPEYCEAANELNGKFILAAVDATQSSNEYVVQKFSVEGYPTLHYFENGQHKFRFTGLNTKEGIMAWLKNPTEKPLMEEKKTEEKPWSEIPSEVVHLDDEKFDAFMASHSSVLVMFYAPWCGHCNKAKPEYMAAAEMLKKDKIDGVLAAVDVTVHRKAAEKVGVEGFPTFAYYKKGKYSWKVNERTKDGFYKFMKNPVEPPSEDSGWSAEDSSVLHLVGDNFKSELKKKRDALVMFYAPWCQYCKRTKPFYWEAARQLSDESRIALAAVDCSVETSLCSDFGIKGFPTIIYLSYGKNRLDYHGRYDNAQAFVDFVKQAGHKDYSEQSPPVKSNVDEYVQTANDGNFKEMISSDKALVYFSSPLCKTCEDARNAFYEAAATAKHLKFVTVDCSYARSICDELKIKDYPTFKLFISGEMHEYRGKHTPADFVDALKEDNQHLDEHSEL